MMRSFLTLGISLLSFVLISGCTQVGDGSSGSYSSGNTQISGKVVTLTGAVASKPSAKAFAQLKAITQYAKPGSPSYKSSDYLVGLSNVVPGIQSKSQLSNANVYLYDSDHPEWLAPVAQSTTDTDGNYTLVSLSFAEFNDDAYINGDAIPPGNYTLLAHKPASFNPVTLDTTDEVVAIQRIVDQFSGQVTGTDLVAEPSDATPRVNTMFGLHRNKDGTQTWGNAAYDVVAANYVLLEPNHGIQINFSMAMLRTAINSQSVIISPSVEGDWHMSADWLTATFYPAAGVLSPDQYTVTVQGGADNDNGVLNVYRNTLPENAIGYFEVTSTTADTTLPTVSFYADPITFDSFIEDPDEPGRVVLDTYIRITSDEPLDANNILLSSTPSLGVHPGIFFVGLVGSEYIYEFELGEPLLLDTTYNLSVTGLEDLGGNVVVAPLTAAFTTETVSAGIDGAANLETQRIQALVKDVFGKWVRSFNDHSIQQLQTMMAGDFVFEYEDISGISEDDINRDGRMSLSEFTNMIERAYTHWDFCQTTMVGDIVGNITILTGAETAQFQFSLDETTQVTTQQCSEGGPADEMFAEVKLLNGQWLLTHVSEGRNTLDQQQTVRDVITLVTPAHGGEIDPPVDSATAVKFDWQSVDNVESYIFFIMDAKDPRVGGALIFPNTLTELTLPFGDDDYFSTLAAYGFDLEEDMGKIFEAFGFDQENSDLNFEKEGAEFYWGVAGLGSITVNDVVNDTMGNVVRDIVAMSRLARYKNKGFFQEATVKVYDVACTGGPDYTPTNGYGTGKGAGAELTFNELVSGYDAEELGGAGTDVCLEVTSPFLLDGGSVNVDGFQFYWQPLDFMTEATNILYVPIKLDRGNNFVNVRDNSDSARRTRLEFAIFTSTGRPPVIDVYYSGDATSSPDCPTNEPFGFDTTDDGNIDTCLTPDQWRFVDTTAIGGATSVTLYGRIDKAQVDTVIANPNPMTTVFAWVSSEVGAPINKTIPLEDCDGNAADLECFKITFELYDGNAWINISGSGTNPVTGNFENFWADTGIHVPTGMGSIYIAPIVVDSVATGTQTNTWGGGQSWDVTTDTDNSVTITGAMTNPSLDGENGQNFFGYRNWSEGPYVEGPISFTGTRTDTVDLGADDLPGGTGADADTTVDRLTFSLDVPVYNGYNSVEFSDGRGNRYNVDLYTDGGIPVLRPDILTVNGDAYTKGSIYEYKDALTSGPCSVVITGNSPRNIGVAGGTIDTNWSSWSGNNSFNEFNAVAVDSVTGNFSFSVPLVAGATNYVDVYDSSGKWAGATINDFYNNCTYTKPVTTLTTVTPNDAGPVAQSSITVYNPSGLSNWESRSIDSSMYPDVVTTPTVTSTVRTADLMGHTNVASRDVTIEQEVCGTKITSSVQAAASGSLLDLDGVGGNEDFDGDTTPDTLYAWNSPGWTLHEQWNYFEISDGANRTFLSMHTSNGVDIATSHPAVTPPFDVTEVDIDAVIGGGPFAGNPNNYTNGCNSSNWYDDTSAGNVNTVYIRGTMQNPGQANFSTSLEFGTVPVNVADGSFEFTLTAYQGWNSVTISDSLNNWYYLSFWVSSSANTLPQFVHVETVNGVSNGACTTPNCSADGVNTGAVAPIAPATVAVVGTILGVDSVSGAVFENRSFVTADVYNYASAVSTRYSSDPNSPDQTLTVIPHPNASTDPVFANADQFSFNINITDLDGDTSDDPMQIGLWVCGQNACHSHYIYLNNACTGCESYNKPGVVQDETQNNPNVRNEMKKRHYKVMKLFRESQTKH